MSTTSNIPFLRQRIFPRSTFTRLPIPLIRPGAGSLKPQPSRGHSEIKGLWSK